MKHYSEKENIIDLWQKVSDVETQIKHSNICDVALKRIKKYYGKKTKDITEKEEEKDKAYFEGETGIFIIEELIRDIIERCKLPEAIELRKTSGYNHDDIIVREESSIAEKILKLFLDENIVLKKKNLTVENPIFGLKIMIVPLKLMKEIMTITTQTMEKKEKTCLKSIIFKFFYVIPMIITLIFLNL